MRKAAKFLHTADWQIGKPFHSVSDSAQQARLRQSRLDTLRGLRRLIEVNDLQFVVVCGDLFDSATPDKATVSALCAAVGHLQVPVFAIPGNHDHGGPGCIWQQDFFITERDALAPNLKVLLEPQPQVAEQAVLLPCPLGHRQQASDPTTWLRSAVLSDLPTDRPWIVIAHGSVLDFGEDGSAYNQIDLARLPDDSFDYIALGDWHGTKQIGPHVWYSGTPEQDRFAKGADNQPGHVLMVETHRGQPPGVTQHRTTRLNWYSIDFDFTGEKDLARFQQVIDERVANRVGEDLVHLQLTGAVGIELGHQLDDIIERYRARLVELRVKNSTRLAPTDKELQGLTQRSADPILSRVARQLITDLEHDEETAEIARLALLELHASIANTNRA